MLTYRQSSCSPDSIRFIAGVTWIMKPCGRAQGRGIFLLDKLSQVRTLEPLLFCQCSHLPLLTLCATSKVLAFTLLWLHLTCSLVQVSGWRKQIDEKEKPETYVVSRYLDQPLLLGGRKFDLRIYVLVLSYVPLVVYLHR